MAANLIIYDLEIAGACNSISKYGESLNELIDYMNAALKVVMQEAIIDAPIAAELNRIASKTEKLKEPISNLTSSVRS